MVFVYVELSTKIRMLAFVHNHVLSRHVAAQAGASAPCPLPAEHLSLKSTPKPVEGSMMTLLTLTLHIDTAGTYLTRPLLDKALMIMVGPTLRPPPTAGLRTTANDKRITNPMEDRQSNITIQMNSTTVEEGAVAAAPAPIVEERGTVE